MVCQTDSELDCVMNAARPLDAGARDAFLRRVDHGVARRSSPRFSVGIFCRRNWQRKYHVRTALG